MIQITFNSKLTKVGNKFRSFSELFKIAPEMVLDAFKANNNLVLSNECRDFLLSQRRYTTICKYIVCLSNHRLERQVVKDNTKHLTMSDNLSFSNYFRKNQHGVFCGVFHGY